MKSLDYSFFFDLAIILLTTKVLGLVMRKLGLPQVVGAILAGILIGPAIFGGYALVKPSGILSVMAEIGVVLIMFSAGLETNLKEIKASGVASLLIAAFGIIVPLALGFCVAIPFFGVTDIHGLLTCVFVGVIITATSVGITVETLKEMGKLKSKVGTVILSAAIIDDVIGIIILSFVIGMKPSDLAVVSGGEILIKVVAFFIFAIVAGYIIHKIFKFLANRYPTSRRIPIFGLVVCFLLSFVSEQFFSIADITGAYLAGIILSTIKSNTYIDRKIEISAYMIFAPIFFAGIGINMSFANFSPEILWFAVAFVAAGIGGKIFGCGLIAKLCKFSTRDSLKIGVGMIARGEVALIVAQKGIASGLIPPIYLTAVVILVMTTSLLAPILLKLLYRGDTKKLLNAPQVDSDSAKAQ